MNYLPSTKTEKNDLLPKRSLLISKSKANLKELKLSYIIGFIIADGSYQIRFTSDESMRFKYQIRANCNITQSTLHEKNVDFLSRVMDSLIQKYSPITVSSTYTGKKKTARRIFFQGANNFKTFKKYLESEPILRVNNKIINPLIGLRYRDYLILEYVENLRLQNKLNTLEGLVTVIHLRYNLHCENAYQMLKATKVRPSFDKRLRGVGAATNREQSFVDTHKQIEPSIISLLLDIDRKCEEHEKMIHNAMSNKTLQIDPWFVTGFFDGDGGSSAILQFRNNNKVEYKCVSYAYASVANKLILEICDYYFKYQHNCTWPGTFRNQNYVTNYNKNYWQLKFQSSLVFKEVICTHFEQYPMQTIKVEALNTCFDLIKKQKENKLSDFKSNYEMVQIIYTSPTTHGAEKRRTDISVVYRNLLDFFQTKNKGSIPDDIDLGCEMEESSEIDED